MRKKNFYNSAIEYLKFKHVFDNIKSIDILIDYKPNYKEVIVSTNKNDYNYIIIDTLNNELFNQSLENKRIITLDNNDNKKFLVKNWSKFVKFNNSIIFFLNLKNKEPKVWSINPYLHHKWGSEKNLSKIILSLSSNKT